MYLLSLDELDRVKRANKIKSYEELEKRTGITRKTWSKAFRTREPQITVLQALSELGARPNKILVQEEATTVTA